MAANKKNVIHNEKELLDRAIETLETFGNEKRGGNVAKYPVIVIFLGKKTSNYLKDVKHPLDDNWGNASNLRYVSIFADGEKISCHKLKVDDEEEKYAWDDENVDPDNCIISSIEEMLGMDEKIFSDCSGVKLDFILDATDEAAKELYEKYKSIELKNNITIFKNLYLMLDQSGENNIVEKSDLFLRYVIEDLKVKPESVFLISNQKKNKRYISEAKIGENYRLISNLILLGGNRIIFDGTNYALEKSLKTASYVIILKPTDQIGEVTIDAFLRNVYDLEEKRFSYDLPLNVIMERLGIGNDGTMRHANEILHNLLIKNNDKNANVVYSFPYATKADLDSSRKNRLPQSIKQLDNMTYGTASQYIETFFIAPIVEYFGDDERKQELIVEMENYILQCFNYFDLLKVAEYKQDIIDRILQPIILPARRPMNLADMFGYYSNAKGRETFYKEYNAIVAKALENVIDYTLDFRDTYKRVRINMESVRESNGEEEKTITSFYENLVNAYIMEEQKRPTMPAYSGMFDVRADRQQLLMNIYNAYTRMVNDRRDIFSLDFEHEMKTRFENRTEAEHQEYVREELRKQIGDNMRLNNYINVEFPCLKNYYLINDKAVYAKHLHEDEGYKSGAFVIFNINRTDCIEEMQIYKVQESQYDLIRLVNPN